MKQPVILFVSPMGNGIRYFLKTDVVPCLLEAGAKVVWITRHPEEVAAPPSVMVEKLRSGRHRETLANQRWTRATSIGNSCVNYLRMTGMSCDMNLAMMRTRSYESEIFIIFTHPRQSLITDSTGKVICDNQRDEETFTITQIDVASVEDTRAKCMSHLNDRRCDVYAL